MKSKLNIFQVPPNLQRAPQLGLVDEAAGPVLVERLRDVVGEQQVKETALALLSEDVLGAKRKSKTIMTNLQGGPAPCMLTFC